MRNNEKKKERIRREKASRFRNFFDEPGSGLIPETVLSSSSQKKHCETDKKNGVLKSGKRTPNHGHYVFVCV